VLSDINMGALNGLEAAVRILANQPNCRVLFLTGQPGLIDIFDPPQENLAYSLMVKPVRIPDLLSATAYMLPPATKANDQAALKIEHDCMELQTLARTAIARLDARRTVGGEDPRQALGQGTTSDATRRCTEITGQPTGIAAIEELWFRLRKRPVQDTRKALSLLRAALLA
jgi:CheY-like chemotaxis protein